jgi:hypothetical protein
MVLSSLIAIAAKPSYGDKWDDIPQASFNCAANGSKTRNSNLLECSNSDNPGKYPARIILYSRTGPCEQSPKRREPRCGGESNLAGRSQFWADSRLPLDRSWASAEPVPFDRSGLGAYSSVCRTMAAIRVRDRASTIADKARERGQRQSASVFDHRVQRPRRVFLPPHSESER